MRTLSRRVPTMSDWPSIDLAVRQVARYERAVIAASGDLDRAQANLVHWQLKLAALKKAELEA